MDRNSLVSRMTSRSTALRPARTVVGVVVLDDVVVSTWVVVVDATVDAVEVVVEGVSSDGDVAAVVDVISATVVDVDDEAASAVELDDGDASDLPELVGVVVVTVSGAWPAAPG